MPLIRHFLYLTGTYYINSGFLGFGAAVGAVPLDAETVAVRHKGEDENILDASPYQRVTRSGGMGSGDG